MISKTHISGQKPRERQLNAKVCSSESPLCSDRFVQQRYLANGLSTHRHFNTKLMLITARSSTTTQRLRAPWSIKAIHNALWLLSSLVLRPRAPPGEKRSGERSRISWAYYPKRVMTNEIARSVIITLHFPYNSKICSSPFEYPYLF